MGKRGHAYIRLVGVTFISLLLLVMKTNCLYFIWLIGFTATAAVLLATHLPHMERMKFYPERIQQIGIIYVPYLAALVALIMKRRRAGTGIESKRIYPIAVGTSIIFQILMIVVLALGLADKESNDRIDQQITIMKTIGYLFLGFAAPVFGLSITASRETEPTK